MKSSLRTDEEIEDEIAKILYCSDSTIRNRLSRARKLLKKYLGGESNDEKNYGFL